jgi:nicotinamidase-related amidase
MSRTALLIIDVQHALCHGEYAGFEADRVISNINLVSQRMREAGNLVVIIQHESQSGAFMRNADGWRLARGLRTTPTDVIVPKTATDSFHKTRLQSLLQERGITDLIVCGLQSEFCVDTTVRRALALGYPITLLADAHTTMDNGVLKAAQISAHHNETLSNIDSFGPRVVAVSAAEVRCQP